MDSCFSHFKVGQNGRSGKHCLSNAEGRIHNAECQVESRKLKVVDVTSLRRYIVALLHGKGGFIRDEGGRARRLWVASDLNSAGRRTKINQ
jgi:hypothetical protein